MTGVIVRILLRYGAGFLVAKGLLSPEDGSTFAVDPDLARFLEMGIGASIGAVTEAYYFFAKKWGWAT
jgi:hypothetical protein